ncbi:hypothetical protein D3C80_1044640 [compost metagenome]
MFERPREFTEQLKIGRARNNPRQERRHARQRNRRIGARTDVAQQMRHQMIQHLASARPNGALVHLHTEIGDQRDHAMAIVVT